MTNDNDGFDEEIFKEIIDVFAKHNVDYLTGIGITMTMTRAGMLGLGMTPDDADVFFKEIAKIYRSTYESVQDLKNDELSCHGDCSNCQQSHDDIPSSNLWDKYKFNLN